MCFRYGFWNLTLTYSWVSIIHLADQVQIGFQLLFRASFCKSLLALLIVTACGGVGSGISNNYRQQPGNVPFLSSARIGDGEIGNQNGVDHVQAKYAIELGLASEAKPPMMSMVQLAYLFFLLPISSLTTEGSASVDVSPRSA